MGEVAHRRLEMTFDIGSIIVSSKQTPKYPLTPCHSIWLPNRDNEMSPCQCYQEILERSKSEVLIYMHSDVIIHDSDWFSRVVNQMTENTVAVGLGGATSLGNRDLYRTPYNIKNLARAGYASNQDDAEVHGERFTGVRRVAVLDAYFMAVRTQFLRDIGGWPVEHIFHHGLDLWLACEAAVHHKEIWQVGVSCLHKGGSVSTTGIYATAPWLKGRTPDQEHKDTHFWLFDTYRHVL